MEEKNLLPEQKNKEGMTPLILAVDCEFKVSTLERLLELGCDINAQDGSGRTALHYAADLENVDIIKFLIGHGADKEIKDNSGSSAKDEAEMSDSIIELF